MDKVKTIGIIGGGIAGLVTAKYAKAKGFRYIIYERRDNLLGVWSDDGYSWPNMSANISKYQSSFIDFVWHDSNNIFPTKIEFQLFLKTYIKEFNLDSYKLNCNVTKVSSVGNKFEIIYLINNIEYKEIVDYIIVATGFNSKPNTDFLDKLKINQQIRIIHSAEYRDSTIFKNKNVIVVGHSHSALQLSAEISKFSNKLINIFKKPYFVVPKFIFSDNYKRYLPIDMIYYPSKKKIIEKAQLIKVDSYKNRNMILSNMSRQNEIHSSLYIDPFSEIREQTAISDNYLEYVKKGLIHPIRAEIENFEGKEVILSDGTTIDTDIILICTGYKVELSFLDENILKRLEFNNGIPTLEGYGVFNSNIKNLALVGIKPRIILPSYEQQAILALRYFDGEDIEIPEERIAKYDNDDTYGYIEKLADANKLLPNTEYINQNDSELFDIIMNQTIIPQFYGLSDPSSELFKKCSSYIKSFYRCYINNQLI